MPHPHSNLRASLPELGDDQPSASSAAAAPQGPLADSAIDGALCRVPLPNGLLNRLNALIACLTAETAEPAG
jgi:hypothetical protein